MKKLIFSCLASLVLVFAAQAQEDPAKALKKAGNALKTLIKQGFGPNSMPQAADWLAEAFFPTDSFLTAFFIHRWKTLHTK